MAAAVESSSASEIAAAKESQNEEAQNQEALGLPLAGGVIDRQKTNIMLEELFDASPDASLTFKLENTASTVAELTVDSAETSGHSSESV